MNSSLLDANPFSGGFDWERQPEAENLVVQLVTDFLERNECARRLSADMLRLTGTRFLDWVDHVAVPQAYRIGEQSVVEALTNCGFESCRDDAEDSWYQNRHGIFPEVAITNSDTIRLAIRVDEVSQFFVSRQMCPEVSGQPGGRFRKGLADATDDTQFWACERHGWLAWDLPDDSASQIQSARNLLDKFTLRKRDFADDAKGFQFVSGLISDSKNQLDINWVCDLFFEAERRYWQGRNQAARAQYARQQQLGLGWGNHDHHTYRSSRKHFADLVRVLEELGFHCRERFYAGADAGWGAQVLEQPTAGITIFADVDLSPEELAGDFAHNGLDPKDDLGTVGLWCQLHGEAFLQAGMHHLECQFDFESARQQLAREGIDSMAPFTNFEFLKQSFTEGERWPVIPDRVEQAVAADLISRSDADRFLREGAVGSHLEVLERNAGFKGFNQTGVSDIIAKTDPRKL